MAFFLPVSFMLSTMRTATCIWFITLVSTVADQAIYQWDTEFKSVVEVCEGHKIHMKAHVYNRTIVNSIFIKDSQRLEDWAPRVSHNGPTSITISDATVKDSGLYSMQTIFTEGPPVFITYDVRVHKGCPDTTEFYDPPLFYMLNKGDPEILPHERTVEVSRNTNVTVNVTIPVATPAVNCTIEGQRINIQRYSRTFCQATFLVTPESGSSRGQFAKVKLKHPQMASDFSTSLYWRIKAVDVPDNRTNTNSSRTEIAPLGGTQSSVSVVLFVSGLFITFKL